MTLLELRAYVQNRVQSSLADPEVDRHINEMMLDLSRLYTPDNTVEVTVATTLNVAEYVLDTATRQVKAVHRGTGATRTALLRIPAESVLYPRTAGTPARWYPYGITQTAGVLYQHFGLDPVPDAADITITAMCEPLPQLLASDTDVPQYIPDEDHHIIAYGALSLLHLMHKKEWELAQVYEARYIRAYNERAAQLGRIGATGLPQLQQQTGG